MALPLLALGSMAAPILGGLLGQSQAAGSAKNAEDAAKRAAGAFSSIELPDIEKMKLALEQYQLTGEYNPLVEQALQLGPSAFENVSTDPRLKQNQMMALQAVADKANTGLSQSDMAAFDLARRNSQRESQSRDQGILQNLAQRGQAGGGSEIALRAISNQEAADRQAQQDLDMAQKQEQARMQALQSLAQMSGSMRTQDYGEQTDLAKARDTINQYNQANSQSIGQRNIANQNIAQQQNLATKQRLSESNTNLSNDQQKYNKGLQQQNFNNQISRAGGVAQGQNQLANTYANQAANTAAGYSAIGNAVGTGANAYGQQQNANEQAAEDRASKERIAFMNQAIQLPANNSVANKRTGQV